MPKELTRDDFRKIHREVRLDAMAAAIAEVIAISRDVGLTPKQYQFVLEELRASIVIFKKHATRT